MDEATYSLVASQNRIAPKNGCDGSDLATRAAFGSAAGYTCLLLSIKHADVRQATARIGHSPIQLHDCETVQLVRYIAF